MELAEDFVVLTRRPRQGRKTRRQRQGLTISRRKRNASKRATGRLAATPIKEHYAAQMVEMLAMAGRTYHAQSLALSPWGTICFGALHSTTSEGEEVLTVGFEFPTEHFSVTEQMDKEENEKLQLERYRTDLLIRGQPVPTKIGRGNEPPDFIMEGVVGGPVGLDFTRFSVTERMASQAAFRRFRKMLLNEPREDFIHLTGHVVYLKYGDPRKAGAAGQPHTRNQTGDTDALIAALRDYRIDPSMGRGEVQKGRSPAKVRFGQKKAPDGTRFHAVPMTTGIPSSPFFLATGFEVGLSYQTDHDVAGAWDEIGRLVDRHDNAETGLLVIEVEAPDRYGFSFPSEGALMKFALEHEAPISLAPKHLKEVQVHLWSNGSLFQLVPNVAGLLPPIHGPLLEAHSRFLPPPNPGNP